MEDREEWFKREKARLAAMTPEQREAERQENIRKRNEEIKAWEAKRKAECVQKADLVDGAYYAGHCRNARVARWFAKYNRFTYWRTKFDYTFLEDINHPADDIGFDMFYPSGKVDEPADKKQQIPHTAIEQFYIDHPDEKK